MQFRILYCRPCGYRDRAEELAIELRSRFGAEVGVEEGSSRRSWDTPSLFAAGGVLPPIPALCFRRDCHVGSAPARSRGTPNDYTLRV